MTEISQDINYHLVFEPLDKSTGLIKCVIICQLLAEDSGYLEKCVNPEKRCIDCDILAIE